MYMKHKSGMNSDQRIKNEKFKGELKKRFPSV